MVSRSRQRRRMGADRISTHSPTPNKRAWLARQIRMAKVDHWCGCEVAESHSAAHHSRITAGSRSCRPDPRTRSSQGLRPVAIGSWHIEPIVPGAAEYPGALRRQHGSELRCSTHRQAEVEKFTAGCRPLRSGVLSRVRLRVPPVDFHGRVISRPRLKWLRTGELS